MNVVILLGICTIIFFIVVLVNEHRHNARRRQKAQDFDRERGRPMRSHPSWSRGAPKRDTEVIVTHIPMTFDTGDDSSCDTSFDAGDCGSSDSGGSDCGGGDCGGGD